MDFLLLYLDEWAWIFTISVAAFLSFDYWRIPDLTIESAFTAGMASVFIASTGSSSGLGFVVIVALLLVVPSILSLITWSLSLLQFPSLFAGLIVTLGAYTLNFHLNGGATSQQIDVNWPGPIRVASMDKSAHFFFLALLFSGLMAILLAIFTTTRIANRIFLSRRTVESVVPHAIGINGPISTLLAMLIYNTIAFTGGVGFALKTSQTSVSLLGAIIPGLACMFILRAIRGLLAAPAKAAMPEARGAFVNWLLRKSDSIWILLAALAVLSAMTSALRMVARDFAKGVAMLNAYTAIGILVVWALISLVGHLMGKRISSNSNEGF